MFAIGAVVYLAEFAPMTEVWVECPDCAGKKYLRVILGNDEEVTIDCVCYRGKVAQWEPKAEAVVHTVRGLETMEGADGIQIRYKFSGGRVVDSRDVFATDPEAMIRAEERGEKYAAAQNKRELAKEKDHKTWAWHVHYHRREVKRAKGELERHEAKLDVAKKKDRGTK